MITYLPKGEKFKHLSQFYPSRVCWEKCIKCSDPWIFTETDYVHLVLNRKKEQMFACDKCIEDIKNQNSKGNEGRISGSL